MKDSLRRLALLCLVAACWPALATAWTVQSEGGSGWVVDAGTGLPLADAVVEASWEVTNARRPEAASLAELIRLEARTDADGRFSLPAWGPVEISLASNLRSVVRIVDLAEPHIHINKAGYRPALFVGPQPADASYSDVLRLAHTSQRDAWWNGRIFELHSEPKN